MAAKDGSFLCLVLVCDICLLRGHILHWQPTKPQQDLARRSSNSELTALVCQTGSLFMHAGTAIEVLWW